MKRLRILPLWLTLLLGGGCEYFEVHPYDTDVEGPVNTNAVNALRIESALLDRSDYRVAVISDTQGRYDETEEAVAALNARGDLDFVLHCGDLSDFGLKKEFQFQRDILNRLTMPCIALIGNHDCLATGQEVFQRIFGETNFAFTAGDTRFICLNTNAMEYDYSVPVPDFDFMEHQLTHLPPGVVRAVWVMHVRPGEFQFNNNVKKAFEYYILRSPGLPFCLYGHEHTARVDDLFGDGVLYYQCPDIGKRTYLLFTMHETGYEYETVVF